MTNSAVLCIQSQIKILGPNLHVPSNVLRAARPVHRAYHGIVPKKFIVTFYIASAKLHLLCLLGTYRHYRHSSTSDEMSGHFGTSAQMFGHFGTNFWGRTVLVPKCSGFEVSSNHYNKLSLVTVATSAIAPRDVSLFSNS